VKTSSLTAAERTRDYFIEQSRSIDRHCFFLDRFIVAKRIRSQVFSVALSRLSLLHRDTKI